MSSKRQKSRHKKVIKSFENRRLQAEVTRIREENRTRRTRGILPQDLADFVVDISDMGGDVDNNDTYEHDEEEALELIQTQEYPEDISEMSDDEILSTSFDEMYSERQHPENPESGNHDKEKSVDKLSSLYKLSEECLSFNNYKELLKLEHPLELDSVLDPTFTSDATEFVASGTTMGQLLILLLAMKIRNGLADVVMSNFLSVVCYIKSINQKSS